MLTNSWNEHMQVHLTFINEFSIVECRQLAILRMRFLRIYHCDSTDSWNQSFVGWWYLGKRKQTRPEILPSSKVEETKGDP